MPWKQDYTISDGCSLDDSDVEWPDGAQCALQVVVDLNVARAPQGIQPADLGTSDAVFGGGEALDLVLAALARHGLRATFAVPGVFGRLRPQQLREIAAAGHEIAPQGLFGEDVSTLAREEEAARMRQATDLLSEATGARPQGWFCLPRASDAFAGGGISAHTVDLLLEQGYAYLGNSPADDIPHWWVGDFAARRGILALPYMYVFDDQFFLLFPAKGTGLDHPDSLLRNWRAELAAQYRRGRMFRMVVHPHAIGWAHRLQMFDDFLAGLAEYPALWKSTGAELAAYWSGRYPAEKYLRLEPSIWQDHEGSLS